MEVVAGSFSRIEYASNGDCKIPFPRELTNIARMAIFAAKEPTSDALTAVDVPGYDLTRDALCYGTSYLEVPLPGTRSYYSD